MEKSKTIYSDDQSAIDKLKNKLSFLEKKREEIKQANKLMKKGDLDGAKELIGKEKMSDLIRECEWRQDGKVMFPSYYLQNLGANIRNVKKRILKLEKLEKKIEEQIENGKKTKMFFNDSIELILDYEINRLQLVFDSKPSCEIRQELKSKGFKWAPSQDAWQRNISYDATYLAKRILKKIENGELN